MRLWISEAGAAARRQQVAQTTFQQAVDELRLEIEPFMEDGEWLNDQQQADFWPLLESALSGMCTLYLATGQQRYPGRAMRLVQHLRRRTSGQDLGKAAVGFHCAMVLDQAAGVCDPAEVEDLAAFTAGLAGSFSEISDGNPDNPFNNWWAVTHSAKGLCALAALPWYPDLQPILDNAIERVRFYASHYGEHGHCYEGTGYGFYAFSYWGPFALAVRHACGIDITDQAIGLPRFPGLLAALTVAIPQISDDGRPTVAGLRGRRLTWNDDGGNSPPAGLTALLFNWVQPSWAASFKWFFDHIYCATGVGGPLLLKQQPLYTWLYYPLDTPAVATANDLPLDPVDWRTGLAVYRNRYQDSHDCAIGVYAKNWHGGGHVHDDAGSFRFIGEGIEWIQAGGQAKPSAENQSAYLVDGRQRLADDPHIAGKILYWTPLQQGRASISLHLANVYRVRRLDRHFAVDYSGADGSSALFAVCDRLWHVRAVDWTWTLTLGAGIEVELAPDHGGFCLRHPSSSNVLEARFIVPATVIPEIVDGPPSQRTFSNGRRVDYPGVRHLRFTLNALRAEVFVVYRLAPRRRLQWHHAVSEDSLSSALSATTAIHLARSRWFEGPLRIEPARSDQRS